MPLRRLVSDKELVKEYVVETTGRDLAVPTLAVLRSASDVDAFEFPERCVIKPTHSSGQIILKIRATDHVDRQRIKAWLSHNFYTVNRERNYRLLEPKVIVEPFVGDGSRPIDEYQVHCFFGKAKFIDAMHGNYTEDYHGRCYTERWKPLPFGSQLRRKGELCPRPACFDEMLRVAELLAAPFSSIRVDFYANDERFFVGEMTNLDGAAVTPYRPEWVDRALGRLFEDQDADAARLCSNAPENAVWN